MSRRLLVILIVATQWLLAEAGAQIPALPATPLIDLGASRSVEAWPGRRIDRRLAGGISVAVDFSLAELCFPYILSNRDPIELMNRPGSREQINLRKTTDNVDEEADNVALVGSSPELQVSLISKENARICSVRVESTDQTEAFKAANRRLQQWPTKLEAIVAPQLTAKLDQRYTLAYCGVRDDGGIDLMSTTEPVNDFGERTRGIALLIFRGPPDPALSCELP